MNGGPTDAEAVDQNETTEQAHSQPQDPEARVRELTAVQRGLQKALYQREQTIRELEAERDSLRKTLEEAQAGMEALQASTSRFAEELDAGKAQYADLQETLAKAVAERDSALLRYRQLDLVAREHPELLRLLFAGALPEYKGDDDAYRQAIGALVEQLRELAGQQAQDLLAGTKPPASPPVGDSASPTDIFRQMQRALDEGNLELFERLKQAWYGL